MTAEKYIKEGHPRTEELIAEQGRVSDMNGNL